MKKYTITMFSAGLMLGINSAPVQAFHCPLLVKECQALVAKAEKRDDVNSMKVAEAKQGCEDALKLHESGQHKESVIKAGEAISLVGQAVK